MPSGAGLLPPILFESAHKMDANQPAPLTPVAPFSGRNISSSYATFAPAATLSATPPPAPTPSPVPATEPTTAAHPTPTPAPVTTSDAQPGADAVAQFLAPARGGLCNRTGPNQPTGCRSGHHAHACRYLLADAQPLALPRSWTVAGPAGEGLSYANSLSRALA